MSATNTLPPLLHAEFEKIEPDFEFVAAAGEAILPALGALLRGDDELAAIRAVAVAGLIGGERALELVRSGSQDPRPAVRVAVAGAMRRAGIPLDEKVAGKLLGDRDPSVRRWMAKTAGIRAMTAMRSRLGTMAENDPVRGVRAAAADALARMGRTQ